MTGGACTFYNEKALLRAHFAMTSTQVAAAFAGPRRRASAFTCAARRCDVDGNLGVFAMESFVE